jgi:putative transposase
MTRLCAAGCDQALHRAPERSLMRIKTQSFIAEFPLITTACDERTLEIRLNAARNLYNACLGESLRRLRLIRESLDWQRACEMAKGKERTAIFGNVKERFDFNSASIQKFAQTCRDACWIGEHLGSHDTQTTSLRAFRAVEMYAFGKRGKPRFKSFNRLHSIEGKADAVIRYRAEPVPAVHYSGLVMPLRLDLKDKREWTAQVMRARTKYVRVIRREIKGRVRWFCQLVQEGVAPILHKTSEGVTGLDIGPSTIAIVSVSAQAATLEMLCPTIVEPWKKTRRLQRAMDRSRRATNPGNFNPNGTYKKGKKRWVRSERYKLVQRKRFEAERRLASERKRSHGELANRLLAQGTTIKTEALSYKSFQKNFGRSVKVRAPGMLVSMLRRKAEGAGGGVIEIKTRNTRLSQFDHTTGAYIKKPLSLRIHVFGDGITEPVQRDLYSAFLATCCDTNRLDIIQVHATWTGAEPLLREAMSSALQPASGKGFARPHVPCVGAGRLSKRVGRSGKIVDVVAQARAAKSLNTGTLKSPRL